MKCTPLSLLMQAQDALLGLAKIKLLADHYVWVSGLSAQSSVLDLGANVGEFSTAITGAFGCSSVAVEPEAGNFARISGSRITKLCVAAGGNDGEAKLYKSDHKEGHSLFLTSQAAAETQGVDSVKVMSYRSILAAGGLTKVDLLKLDIEGAEWAFFANLTDEEIRSIPQITVEFHDFIPELRPHSRTAETQRRFHALGFVCIEDVHRGSYNTLFLKTDSGGVPLRVILLIRGVHFLGKMRQWYNGLRRRLKFLPGE